MKQTFLAGLALVAVGLAAACGTAPAEPAAGAVQTTADLSAPTPTRIALPSPTPAEAPRLRARGIITAITEESLTFMDIDGNNLSLKRSPDLKFPWEQLQEAHQKRSRITVVYQEAAGGLVLVDVFPT